MRILQILGKWGLSVLAEMGRMLIFLTHSLLTIFKPPFKISVEQIRFWATSLSLSFCSQAFTGMVLALQLFYFRKFGSVLYSVRYRVESHQGTGSVLCALMITGRAGSALTAEIG
jgi:phospholipid/cholesterol/gamma-HCH transport system permease protein